MIAERERVMSRIFNLRFLKIAEETKFLIHNLNVLRVGNEGGDCIIIFAKLLWNLKYII